MLILNKKNETSFSKSEVNNNYGNTQNKIYKKLVPLTGDFPYNAEVESTKLLLESGFITPEELCFVRNHGEVPELKWGTHRLNLEIYDYLNKTTKEVSFSMKELRESFNYFTIPVTFACNGNRRKELNMIKNTLEFDWGSGAVSNCYYGGIKVRDLIIATCSKHKLEINKNFHVHFEGSEDLPNGKYGTSIPYGYAIDEKNDVILAFEQNFKPLTKNHGYPLRLIIPGFIGGRNVKWLAKIKIVPEISTNWYHIHDNRKLPPHIETFHQAETEGYYNKNNKNFTLGYLNELVVQSIITHPVNGFRTSFFNGEGSIEVKGYAYNGGGREISKVELSIDNGENWERIDINYQPDYLNKNTKKVWVWCFFYKKLKLIDLLDKQFIKVRAVDKSNKTQLEDLQWSLKGFFNNSIYKLKIEYDKKLKEFVFYHPVQAGKTRDLILSKRSIGWMECNNLSEYLKPKLLQKDIKISTCLLSSSEKRYFTIEEVKKHNNITDCYVIIEDKVYDLTEFSHIHKGGSRIIHKLAGKDITLAYKKVHSKLDKKLFEKYHIGFCKF